VLRDTNINKTKSVHLLRIGELINNSIDSAYPEPLILKRIYFNFDRIYFNKIPAGILVLGGKNRISNMNSL
jgi:hypothetical protein